MVPAGALATTTTATARELISFPLSPIAIRSASESTATPTPPPPPLPRTRPQDGGISCVRVSFAVHCCGCCNKCDCTLIVGNLGHGRTQLRIETFTRPLCIPRRPSPSAGVPHVTAANFQWLAALTQCQTTPIL